MDVTLRQLEYFCAVAAAGSLSEAAKAAHVSPSALSLAMTELERSLGVALTVRDRRSGTALTPAGKAALVRARQILQDVEALVNDADGPLVGELTLGVPRGLSAWALPRLLPALAEEHPKLRVGVVEDTPLGLQDRLVAGSVDGALVLRAHVREDGIRLDTLMPLPVCAVVPQSHPCARQAEVSLAELADESFILLDSEPSLWNTLRMFDAVGRRPRVRWSLQDKETILALVRAGEGLSVLVGDEVMVSGTSGVVFVPLTEGPRHNAVVLATARAAERPAVVELRRVAAAVLGVEPT
jgi:DNA-binding transcriptional LysR family regulator